MQLSPKVTLIISTYNYPEALELVLLSVAKQSVVPNEVIIADDGSKKETKELIEKLQQNFSTKLVHLWHEDNGFRKTIILNKAICISTSEYIIQIDGDIIIHKHFIKNHVKNARKGFFTEGSRTWLNGKVTEDAQKNNRTNFFWFSNGIKNRINAMYIPFLTPLFEKRSKNINYAIDTRGCNMSFWRSDLIEVNGYNEDMTGWGREDSEISVRLVNAGKTKKRIKFGAIQFHQYHSENSRSGLNKNDEILAIAVNEKVKRCKNGLSNHCNN